MGKPSPVAQILFILKQLPEAERLDVLATVCSVWCQTNGAITVETRRTSQEVVLGPLKRLKGTSR